VVELLNSVLICDMTKGERGRRWSRGVPWSSTCQASPTITLVGSLKFFLRKFQVKPRKYTDFLLDD
jgi:hypothetical protein